MAGSSPWASLPVLALMFSAMAQSDGRAHREDDQEDGYEVEHIGNGDVPDVRLEAPGSAANPDTQYWHVVKEPQGGCRC